MNCQAVFFDFDGVILDSVQVKTNAFARMFHKYGSEIEQAVIKYHLNHGGESRFRKFEYYYSNLLHKPIDQDVLNALNEEFTELALQGVLEAPFIPGVWETLKQLKEQNIDAFLVSGTPDEELKRIVERRELSSFFSEVHGSPRKKHDIISDIGERYLLHLPRCLLFGDSSTDYEAAQSTGTTFVGIVPNGRPSPFPKECIISERVSISFC